MQKLLCSSVLPRRTVNFSWKKKNWDWLRRDKRWKPKSVVPSFLGFKRAQRLTDQFGAQLSKLFIKFVISFQFPSVLAGITLHPLGKFRIIYFCWFRVQNTVAPTWNPFDRLFLVACCWGVLLGFFYRSLNDKVHALMLRVPIIVSSCTSCQSESWSKVKLELL